VRPWVRSVAAVAAGFLVTAVASTATDAVMHAAGIFPSSARAMSDPLFALAAAYRALFTVAGGYATARLAPDRPMRHAWILAGIGLVAGLAGVGAYFAIGGAELGPAWYAISIPLEAIPCVWLGARLALTRRAIAHPSACG
jgi:peptidoglycan/LPS O-acetylase OafA/YrhL